MKEKESSIELAICHFIASYLRKKNIPHHFWKQPQAGFAQLDRRTKTFRFRRHTNPFVGLGVPDIIVIIQGIFVGLECKTKAGKQSPNQIEFESLVRHAGGFYYIVRSLSDAENALNAFFQSVDFRSEPV